MLKKVIEFFIPPKYDADSEYQRRIRLITYALFITAVFSLFYVSVSWISGFLMGMIIMFFCFVFFTSLLFLIKFGVDIFLIANIFGFAGIVSISGCIYFSGGLSSPIMPWLASTPIVILLLAGKKSGSFWAGFSVVLVIVFALLARFNYPLPNNVFKNNIVFSLSCNLGLVLIIFFISFVFENVRIRAFNIVSAQKDTLEETLYELKTTQAQLIQSEKMASLGELTAGIAHEIQNPLNFVNNFSELNKELANDLQQELQAGNIKEAIDISNYIKENEEKIAYHGKRADAIVKGMLQHSRKNPGVKELTDINALCEECLRLSYHGLRAKDKALNAVFKTDFDKDAGQINIISQDISRVVLNILNNAFYAVNEKKKSYELSAMSYEPLVSVQTKKINDKVEITVTDNGNGIPKNIVDKIFQPFFTTKPSGQGTGLGLSLSYDIITKAHGGTLKVETKENVGSDFIIQLPYN